MENIKDISIYDKAKINNTLVYATIELLTKCNWRCKHCYLPSHNHYGLSKEKIFDIFKQLRELGCFEIEFTGGEIFYREDTLEILKKAREMGFNVNLLTNVSLLDENKIKSLCDMYIYKIECTIFSLNEEIHDSITGVKGSLKKAMSNIMLMKKYNMKLKIKTILMKDNIDSYKDLKLFCEKHGFDYLATSSIYPKNDGDLSPQELALSIEQLESVIPEIDEIRKFKLKSIDPDKHICNSLRYSLIIDSYGEVYPCNMLRVTLGNVHKQSLKNIWYDSKILRELKDIRWNRLEHCLSCDKNSFCFRCAGLAFLETGNKLDKCPSECKNANIRLKNFLESIECFSN
ncbi:MAG: radical SAM protein [Bacilli bacterium]